MSLVALLLSQSISTQTEPKVFDLRSLPVSSHCGDANTTEIVVCGQRDPDKYRVKPIPNADRFEQGPLIARVELGHGATASAEAEAVSLGAGVQSNRMMARLKIKF